MTTAERIRKARTGGFNTKPNMRQVTYHGQVYAVPASMHPATFKRRMDRNGGDYRAAIDKPLPLNQQPVWQPGMYSGRTELTADQRAAMAKYGVKPPSKILPMHQLRAQSQSTPELPPLLQMIDVSKEVGIDSSSVRRSFIRDGSPVPVVLKIKHRKYYVKKDLLEWAKSRWPERVDDSML